MQKTDSEEESEEELEALEEMSRCFSQPADAFSNLADAFARCNSEQEGTIPITEELTEDENNTRKKSHDK